MRRFFFRFRCPTRLSVGNNWRELQAIKPKGLLVEYLGDKANLRVFDESLPTQPARMHFGLGIDSVIEHTDINEAHRVVNNIMDQIISLLAFTEACYVGAPEFVLRYRFPQSGTHLDDVTAYTLDKNYVPHEQSPRSINLDRFMTIFSGIDSLNDDKLREAIWNSLRWFRKALESKDASDRFLQIWIAIEHLRIQLRDFYELPRSETHYPKCEHCKKDFRKCPSCEDDFGYKVDHQMAGYKRLEQETGLEKGLFNQLHKARSKLVHGGEAIQTDQIKRAISDSHQLLSKALFTLIGIDHEMTVGLSTNMRGPALPFRMYFEGNMEVTKPLELTDTDLQPVVYGEYDYEYHIDDSTNTLELLGEVHHNFQGAFESGKMAKKALSDSNLNLLEAWERE